MNRHMFRGRAVKGVLLDITGNLYNSLPEGGVEEIPGSVEAIARLRKANIPFRLITNETEVDRKHLQLKLKRAGFDIDIDHLFCPAPVVAKVVRERRLRPYLLVYPDLLPEFDGIDQSSPNCVVLGDANHHFTYDNLNNAFRVLIGSENPVLLSMGKGKYYKNSGKLTLDLGAYMSALEYACDIKAEVFGKPAKAFFMSALQDMQVNPDEAVMVGDDIVNDVGGAQSCGMTGILVRTGKFRPVDENHPTVKTDAVVDNLAAAMDMILAPN